MLFKHLKGKCHRKRYFVGTAIVMGIGFLVWHCCCIAYPANIASKLSLELHVDKMKYVQAEPVRLTVSVVNNTDEPIEISYPTKRRPFSISFFMSKRSNNWHETSKVPFPRVIRICSSGLRLLPPRHRLVIQPDDSLVIEEWVMDSYTTDLGHGQVDFMAKLVLNSSFSSKAKNIESNKLKIEYTKPQGKDKAAYDLITSKKAINTKMGSFGPGFLLSGLIYNSGSHHGGPVHQYFLKDHASTTYAPYLQYTQAMTHRHHRCQEYGEILSSLLETARSDFPLLPEICIELLDYYWNDHDFPKMAELAKSNVIKQLNVLNPGTRRRLDYLVEQIAWWPPDTAAEKQKAQRAFRTRQAVKTARSHWLTETLLKAYGDHYGNELQFSDRRPDRITLYFYDKKLRECIFITYHFDSESSLMNTRISGPLVSASVGPLKELSSRLQDDFKLDEQDLAAAKIDAVLTGKTLKGRLFKGKQKDTTIISPFTIYIRDL